MRTTKVIAFSVPAEMEKAIIQHAKSEHRTLSEYVREAIRRYMGQSAYENALRKIRKKVKAKGIKLSDVEDIIEDLRNP